MDSGAAEVPGEPSSTGPGQVEPSRWRRSRRMLRWTALVLGVVLLVTATAAFGLYRYYGSKVGTVEGLPRLAEVPGADEGVQGRSQNYLLVGSDSADGLTREQLRAIGTSRKGRDGTRTDTILLLQVPADGSRARVVSFPRDSWVTIPGHGQGKLNGAYDLGEDRTRGTGPSTLVATIERLSGVQIDHYVEVSLYGFVRITDALGGVQVCLAAPARERDARIDLPAGRQRLDGKQALAFVRQRNGVPGGDLGRIRRQQHFLSAVTREVLRAGTLLNPLALDRLLDAVTSSVRVDPGTEQSDLVRLGLQMRRVTAGAVRFQTVPVLDPDARVAGQSVVLLDHAALPAFFADTAPARPPAPASPGPTPSAPPPPPPPLTVPPSSIVLVVENGSGIPGLAGSVVPSLRQVGFRVREVRNAPRQDHPQTVVRHGANRADSARTTSAALPGSVLVRDDTLGPQGLVVTLGAGHQGVQPVSIVPPTEALPGSAAVPRTAADDDCVA